MKSVKIHWGRWFAGVLAIVVVIVGGYYAKGAYDHAQAKHRLNEILAANGFPARKITVRTAFHRETTGPFSGVTAYQMSFSNHDTVLQSRLYLSKQGKSTSGLRVSNSPIVYRVSLNPPSPKHANWQASLYMDEIYSKAGFDATIGHLQKTSYRELQTK